MCPSSLLTVGGGVLVSPGAARQDSGDAAESFVPPIRNGIQLQQRRRRTPVAVRSEGDVAEVGCCKQSANMVLVDGLMLCHQRLQCCKTCLLGQQ